MTAVYRKQGNLYTIGIKESMEYLDKLPPDIYLLKVSEKLGLYVEVAEPFATPPKIYGSILTKAERILDTFEDRPSGTGVLLVGQKGSGKTLLARSACMAAIKRGMPVIIVNTPYHGDGFNSFIQSLQQPMVILFDEFEKVYSNKDHQTAMLTLLDGVFPSQKLFMFTCNDKYSLNEYMRNRPGRIYYMFEFSGIEEEFIVEYARDNLKPEMQIHLDRLVQVSSLFSSFNFDMLKAIIEEMNRYGEPPQDVITILNTKPEFSGSIRMIATLWKHGKKIPTDWIYSDEFDVSVIKDNFSIELSYRNRTKKPKSSVLDSNILTLQLVNDEKDEDEDTNWIKVRVTRHDMISLSRENGIVFETEDKVYRIVLKEKQYDKWNWKTGMDGVEHSISSEEG